MSRVSPAVALVISERDRGRCLRCGGRATNRHQRVGAGSGGRKGEALRRQASPANHVSLCGSGTTGCHGACTNPAGFGLTREQLEQEGWIVRRNGGQDPALVPLRTDAWPEYGPWVLLGHDGDVSPSHPPE